MSVKELLNKIVTEDGQIKSNNLHIIEQFLTEYRNYTYKTAKYFEIEPNQELPELEYGDLVRNIDIDKLFVYNGNQLIPLINEKYLPLEFEITDENDFCPDYWQNATLEYKEYKGNPRLPVNIFHLSKNIRKRLVENLILNNGVYKFIIQVNWFKLQFIYNFENIEIIKKNILDFDNYTFGLGGFSYNKLLHEQKIFDIYLVKLTN